MQHPDFKIEEKNLESILSHISDEKTRLEEQNNKQEEEVRILTHESGGIYSSDLDIAQRIFAMTMRNKANILKTENSPYFTRIDFVDSNDKLMQLYIGKHGLLEGKSQKPIIIDWRSPIANLYYTHQVGPASYKTPYDEEISGEILVKRLFEIEKSKLLKVIEADIITESEYLNDVLSDHADARLKDVVTTIQSEQNAVLRRNPKVPLVVQGVAGAGKTTIALHRIMWLLYTFQDTMKAENVLIIAPTPIFLDYISAVLPGMGVDNVVQDTFYGLAVRLCGKTIYKIDDSNILIDLLDGNIDENEKDKLVDYAKLKGSMEFKQYLQEFIAEYPKRILPSNGIYIGKKLVIPYAEIYNIFSNELSPYNFKDRVKELKKTINNYYKNAVIIEKRSIEREVVKRANYIREKLKNNSQKRQEYMKQLYGARDEKIAEIDAESKNYINNYIKQYKIPKLMDIYREFLEFIGEKQADTDSDALRTISRITLDDLDRKRIQSNDIPPLLMMQKAFFGFKEKLDIHHTVLDEAQDFSPFMFDILHLITNNDAFTIVGDTTQGIYSYQGVVNWQDMIDTVFESRANYNELITSYRNTIEIMELAEQCAMRHDKRRTPAKPVLRHGELPKLVKTNNAIDSIIDEVNEQKAKGMKTIAIIDKMPRDCKKLYKTLSKKIPDLKYLDEKLQTYEGGIMVLPAYMCKGFEFDCVIIANGNEDNFPDDLLHSRLMYVCLTRPIHTVTVYYKDEPTKLIDAKYCQQIETND